MAEQKEEPKAELQVIEQSTNFYSSKEGFALVQRVASLMKDSDLLPAKYKGNMSNCVIAIEMAQRMGVNPLMVMQNLDVIMGRPCWSSQFLIASLNQSGKFSPLRYEDDDKEGGRTRAWAIDKLTNDKVYGVWVSMEMAKAEGWVAKNGSKWKTMPELMRRYRAASFFTKQFAPEISMGFQTVEEVIDITPIPVEETKGNKEKERVLLMIGDCKTKEELLPLEKQCEGKDDLMNAYLLKLAGFNEPKDGKLL